MDTTLIPILGKIYIVKLDATSENKETTMIKNPL